ncbi:MAG: hypothetical protein JWO50_102 [Candidatus Kaiserbacteria bacterium]|nr:hypothetical protein [Candidatus Kaiserbacteria bacterium]
MSNKIQLIRMRSLPNFGISVVLQDRLARWVLNDPLVGKVHRSRSRPTEIVKRASQVTVGDVMSKIEEIPFWDSKNRLIRYPNHVLVFKRRLRQFHVSQEDWPYISDNIRIIIQYLRQQAAAKGRQELLALNARFLCPAAVWLLPGSAKEVNSMTIGDLLQIDPRKVVERKRSSYVNARNGVLQVIQEFRDLGFGYEDGLLMQAGTRQYEIEQLCKHLHIPREQAESYLQYAEDNRWGPRLGL